MKNLYLLAVIALLSLNMLLFAREETELVIGYIPETQTIVDATPSTTERKAIAVLVKAAQLSDQQEPGDTMSPFQDPMIV